jgi:hypothetical protein
MISPQAYTLAKQHLQGVPPDQMMGALGTALNADPNVSLMQLITAHKLLTQEQQKQQAMQAMQMAQQGAGLPGALQSDKTVAQQVTEALRNSNQNIEQQVMASAAQPAREGGIADLNAGRLGEEYASGGIIAFGEPDGDQLVKGESGADISERANRLQFLKDAGLNLGKGILTPAAAAMDVAKGLFHPVREALYTAGLTKGNPEYTSTTKALWADGPDTSSERGASGSWGNPGASGSWADSAAAPTAPTAAAPAQPGLPSAMPAARAANAATGRGEPVSTPAMDAARSSITELRQRGLKGLDNLNNAEIDPATGKPVPKKTLASIATEQDIERKKALKDAGLPDQGFKERINELVTQANSAKQDRDTDRLLATAAGFFAIGAGNSRYAMQNMAEGLGVGTKQLQAAEKEYRIGEKARQESVGVLKQAQRAEVLGHQKEAADSYGKYQDLMEKQEESKRRTAEHLLTTATIQEGNLAAKEAALINTKAIKDASLASTAAYREGIQEAATARNTETSRRNQEVERQKFAQFQQRAQEKHPLMVGKTLPNALTQLEDLRQKLAQTPADQKLISNINSLQTQVDKMQDRLVNESAKDATRMMGANNGFRYVGVQ